MKIRIGGTLTIFLILVTAAVSNAEISLSPRIRAGIEYTDNFFLTNDNPGSEKESEWTTTISPGVTLDMLARTASLSLSYDPTYNMYDTYSDRNYWSHAVNLAGSWQTTKDLSMQATHTYLYTEDPIDEDDLTLRRRDNPYTRNTTTARIDYRFGAENTVYMDGLYSFLENEDPAIQDSDRAGGSAGMTYWVNIRWGIDLGGEYYQSRFDVSDDYEDMAGRLRLNYRFNPHFTAFAAYRQTFHQFEDESNDYEIYDGSIGFDYAIDPSMDLTVEVHYFVRAFEETEDESETPVNVNFTKRFKNGSINLNGEGGYNRTTVTAEDLGYYIYYGVTASGDYAFTRRISGDVNAGYTYRDYKDEVPRREDDVIRAGCGLSFQLMRWLSARLGYTFNSVESTIEANDYVENRASLMLTIAPPQPYRF